MICMILYDVFGNHSREQKIVVVDNRLAFIGGLDLCYGRWDTHEHKLVDLKTDSHRYEMVPGQDYSNPRVKDFANGERYSNLLNFTDIQSLQCNSMT